MYVSLNPQPKTLHCTLARIACGIEYHSSVVIELGLVIHECVVTPKNGGFRKVVGVDELYIVAEDKR